LDDAEFAGALSRALRLAAIALGIGLVMTAGAARAQDDDEDDKTFEEKVIEGIMAGIGGTNMDTGASSIASGLRWWFLPSSICRRRLPPRMR